MWKEMTAYFLVNCQEGDVWLFHGKEEHERTAAMADSGCAATAVHEGTGGEWTQDRDTVSVWRWLSGAQAWGHQTPQLIPNSATY